MLSHPRRAILLQLCPLLQQRSSHLLTLLLLGIEAFCRRRCGRTGPGSSRRLHDRGGLSRLSSEHALRQAIWLQTHFGLWGSSSTFTLACIQGVALAHAERVGIKHQRASSSRGHCGGCAPLRVGAQGRLRQRSSLQWTWAAPAPRTSASVTLGGAPHCRQVSTGLPTWPPCTTACALALCQANYIWSTCQHHRALLWAVLHRCPTDQVVRCFQLIKAGPQQQQTECHTRFLQLQC